MVGGTQKLAIGLAIAPPFSLPYTITRIDQYLRLIHDAMPCHAMLCKVTPLFQSGSTEQRGLPPIYPFVLARILKIKLPTTVVVRGIQTRMGRQ